jgi:hypothetical protein
MAQAQAAALAAAAAVSAAVIEASDDADGHTATPTTPRQQLQQQQFEPVGVTDAASLPSSLLLRDIHTGLIRLMDGSGPKPGKRGLKPPATARLCPTESHRQLQVGIYTGFLWVAICVSREWLGPVLSHILDVSACMS